MAQASDDDWWSSINAALAVGQQVGQSSDQFNLACEHIASLLRDASTLLAEGSHATAAFLAITALEEAAKVHLGMYRRATEPAPRRKDPLYRHDEKHRLALGPTVAMGSRLQHAIGAARMKELMEQAHNGGFMALREAALYVAQDGDTLHAPAQVVAPSTARELLLLAIEAFDDGLVGYTDRTFALGEETDRIFARWADGPALDEPPAGPSFEIAGRT